MRLPRPLPPRQCSLAIAFALCSISLHADDVEFFERRIRPHLIDYCLDCHSHESEVNGGLSLDSRDDWQVGGDLGPAVEPGKADESLLMRVIEYTDPHLQMPPDGKLDDSVIADFRKWIQNGAADPRRSDRQAVDEVQGLPVANATDHWAYRSLTEFAKADSPVERSPDQHSLSARIDDHIDQRLQQAGLAAAGPADRTGFIRRLSFDLTGLPPTAEDVREFVADNRPGAKARLVDRLLASAAYGEHLARRWLDVVRYAESITLRGFVFENAWRYRDYVIDAFNRDRGFDQLVIEQLAGDLLPLEDLAADQSAHVATAFLAMGNTNLEQQHKTQLDFDHIDEQLETIGRAFMGQTIGCARCHDHKFDPIPTRDYYALAAIFRCTTAMRHDNVSKWIDHPLPISPQLRQRYDKLAIELKDVREAIKRVRDERKRYRERAGLDESEKSIARSSLAGVVIDDADAALVGDWTESTFAKGFVGPGYRHDGHMNPGTKTATFEPTDLPPGDYHVRLSYTASPNRASRVKVQVFGANELTSLSINQRKAPPIDNLWVSLGQHRFEAGGQAYVIISNEDADGHVIIDAVQFLPVDEPQSSAKVERSTSRFDDELDFLARRERELADEMDSRPHYMTVLETEPRDQINIRVRGLVDSKGESVRRGLLSAVGPADQYARAIGASGSGRLELAHWLVDPRHPLTARVYANRVWSWMMGEGLVATENNFGTTGEAPSHPELLDRLAQELIQSGWSTKHLVRQIVLSDAYGRATVSPDSDATRIDPDNRLYWSANLKSLPVEALRDAMLVLSGELDRTVGGKTIRPGTKADYRYEHDLLRRSVYAPLFRNSLPPLFVEFDFADPSVSTGQRSTSIVANQSLAILNHPWVIQRCRAAARRWVSDFLPESGDAMTITRARKMVVALHWAALGRPVEETERLTYFRAIGIDETDTDSSIDPEQILPRLELLIQAIVASLDFRYLP